MQLLLGDGPKLRDKVLTPEYGVVQKLLELLQKPSLQVMVHTELFVQLPYLITKHSLVVEMHLKCLCSHHI